VKAEKFNTRQNAGQNRRRYYQKKDGPVEASQEVKV
jgi:hypothetical protein